MDTINIDRGLGIVWSDRTRCRPAYARIQCHMTSVIVHESLASRSVKCLPSNTILCY